MVLLAVNLVIVFLILVWIVKYSLRMKSPYPRWALNAFNEQYVRLFVYILLYVLCFYNPVVGLVAFIGILLLHLDYINLYIK